MRTRFIAILVCSTLLSLGNATAQSSRWEYGETPDPITDELRYHAAIAARLNIGLVVVCNENFVSVSAKTAPIDMELGETRQVTWRVDNNKAISQTWDNLNSGAAVYDEEAVAMARAMKEANSRIVIRSGRATVEFSAIGSTAAISKVMERCPNPMLK